MADHWLNAMHQENRTCDDRPTAQSIRRKLLEYDLADGAKDTKVQAMVVLPVKAAEFLEILRYQFKIPKTDFFSAAAGLFIREFEQLYRRRLPVDPFHLSALDPTAAKIVMEQLSTFRDSVRYDFERILRVQGQITRESDAKLGHIVYLLRLSGRWRTSKRAILGVAVLRLLSEIHKDMISDHERRTEPEYFVTVPDDALNEN